MTEASTEQLAQLIDKRHRCLVQLRETGRRQSELIATGEIGPLLRLLSSKNQLIVALQSIEKQLAPFHDQDPEQRRWSSPAARQRCAAQVEECRQLLDEVMRLERENEKQMITRRDQVAQQLQSAQLASTARAAYQAHSHGR